MIHWRSASTKKYEITRRVYSSGCPCGSCCSHCWRSPWQWAYISACALPVGEIGWVCVLAAFPFALGGFFQYNGMTLERFLLAYIRSEFLFPRRLVFKSDNIYAKALENSTIKEALKLD